MFVTRYCAVGVFILLNLNVLCHGQKTTGLAYPRNEEADSDKQNAQGKSPVYVKDFCKDGEILYPGDQVDDWVCDCEPGYIYHPKTEKCYPSHRQGPCENKHHLMLPPNSVVPVCQENPCADNFVQYKGKCYELDKVGPCDLRIHFSNVIGVNETTLEIICTQDYKMNIPPSVGLRLGDEDEDTENSTAIKVENGERLVQPCTLYKQKRCFVGGIRWTRTICPTQISANEVDGQIQSSMVVSPA